MGLFSFQNSRIATKFILWFLFIALLPLAIATTISYLSSRAVLQEEVANSLHAIADNRAGQIETFLREKERNVTQLSHMSDVTAAVDKFKRALDIGGANSEVYSNVEQEFKPLLAYHQKTFGYDDLALISAEGEVLFSVEKQQAFRSVYEMALGRDSELAAVFIKTKKSSRTEVSGFEQGATANQASVFIAAPVLRAGEFIGALVAEMSNQGLFTLVSDYEGLGTTGETILLTQAKDDIVFVTPLRFDQTATFKKIAIDTTKKATQLQEIAELRKGLKTAVDYRDKQVLETWRYLPAFKLGIMVKMDTAEIFSSARRLRNILLLVSLGLSILVVLVAVVVAHTISIPINTLTQISGIITGGDLSARAEITTKDEIGQLAAAFNQMTDSLVEERTKLEEQKKLLEKANHELDSFVYTASHDLRAPLRAISRFSSFLYDDYKDKLDEEGRSNLSGINKGAIRMNQLIDDLLELSRISRVKNPYEDVNINELIDSAMERLKFNIKESNVDFKLHCALPTVRCDRIKMGEVFFNLINNAIKFSSKGPEKTPQVEVGCSQDGDYYEFYVKDNGIGIESEFQQEIFGVFRRLHSSSEYEGTGMGLSIVKRVINDHGGEIWVESEYGKGSCFYFTIPKKV
ncbi:ATP-binding protein [Candidatus Omnitrophota bacterium]